MNKKILLKIFLFYFGLSIFTFSQSWAVKCEKVRMISTKRLWFKEAHFEYIDIEMRRGKPTVFASLRKDPSFCYQVIGFNHGYYKDNTELPYPWKVNMKTRGYLDAIEKWIYWKPLDYTPKDWPQGKTIRQRIQKLTHISFKDRNELKQWFEENKYYVNWIEEKGYLVVDLEAKKARKKFHKFWTSKLKPVSYWTLTLRGFMDDQWQTDKAIRGEAHERESGFIDLEFPLTAPKDMAAKKEGYKIFLRHSIEGLKRSLSSKEKFHYKSKVYFIETLNNATGLMFDTREEWIEWYEKNKDNLVFSKDGKRMIVAGSE